MRLGRPFLELSGLVSLQPFVSLDRLARSSWALGVLQQAVAALQQEAGHSLRWPKCVLLQLEVSAVTLGTG